MTTALHEFKMPDVGEGLTEAEILKWYVQPGDTVTDGQIVCEVETAKAAVELPIPFNGTVQALHFPEGTTVDVGTAIIAVAVAGGPAAAPAPVAAAAPADAEPAEPERREVLVGYGPRTGGSQRRARRTPAPAAVAAAAAVVASAPVPVQAPVAVVPAPAPAVTQPGAERPLAKPPVRKLAKDLGIDLRSVVPTGPDGIITREDVHAAAAPAPAAATPAQAPATVAEPVTAAVIESAPVTVTGGDVRIPIKGVRKATASAMVASAFTAPHVTEFVQVDVTRTMKLVRTLKETGELGQGCGSARCCWSPRRCSPPSSGTPRSTPAGTRRRRRSCCAARSTSASRPPRRAA